MRSATGRARIPPSPGMCCAVAAWRRCVCEPAAAPRRLSLEHRCRAAGKRGSRSDPEGRRHHGPVAGTCGVDAQCIPAVAINRVYKPGPADFQFAAHISVGRRSDSAVAPVVCDGPSAQFDGGDNHWFPWCSRPHRPCREVPIRLVWCHVRLHFDELLEGTPARASVASSREIAASKRIFLPLLQNVAPLGRLLALLDLPEIVRYLPIAGRLPALLDTICNDRLFGLWKKISDERMGWIRPRPASPLRHPSQNLNDRNPKNGMATEKNLLCG